jgi:predicted MPP superfamily phosphohydrolase
VVADLPAGLQGFKIGQISDIHLGLWSNQAELAQSLEVLASLEPDLVALTGDLVDRNAEFARLYHEPLKILQKTPHGVWGVLGNHDHYTGRPERVAELLDGHGLNMLMDRRANLPGLPLALVGLNDQGAHLNWVGRALSAQRRDDYVLNFETVTGPTARPGDFIILLNHRPEGLAQAVDQGVRLYLAGHTHGGQYQLPYFDQANVAAFFYKYTCGLYQEGPAWINVSQGVASVAIPFRLWAWPEVSLITLLKG